MSRAFANASLAGCAPSTRYQTELKALQDAMEGYFHSSSSFGEMCKDVGFQGFWMHGEDNRDYTPCLKTDDGGTWFCARMFVTPHGGFVILFPWHGDREKKDGSSADKALQIHRFGCTDHSYILEVLHKLTEWAVVYHERFPDGPPPSCC